MGRETVLEDIPRSYEDQEAINVTTRTIESIQKKFAELLQNYMNHPKMESQQIIPAPRWYLDS